MEEGLLGLPRSESTVLFAATDRRANWAVVVCLVNTGEAVINKRRHYLRSHHTGFIGFGNWLGMQRHRLPPDLDPLEE